MPRILEGVALGEVVRGAGAVAEAKRIERIAPLAVRVASAHEADGGVEHVLPVLRALREERGVLRLAELRGHLRGAPVVVGALERARDAFALDFVEGVVAVLVEEVPVLLAAVRVGIAERVADGGVDGVPVGGEALEVGVHQHGHGVRADHALVVLVPERPDREEAVLLVVGHH